MSEQFHNDDESMTQSEAPEAASFDGSEHDEAKAECLEEPVTKEAGEDVEDLPPEPQYRWDFASYSAYEREYEQKQRKRGILVFAISTAAIFAVCILLLVGVILLNGTPSYLSPVTDDVTAIGAVAQAVKPSVVLIEGSTGVGTTYGSGFFLTYDGYIATNYHVVKNTKNIKVTLSTGKSYEATLKGAYAPDDLAVLKIEGTGFPVPYFGDSDALRVGDAVVAIGNPSGAEGAWTTTHGIVSALNRKVAVSDNDFNGLMKMIQTDAPVNPGNSGGPLCDLNGDIVGIVTQKLSNYEAIGFAIPINEALVTLHAIIDGKEDSFESEVTTRRAAIGVTVQTILKGEEYYFEGEKRLAAANGVLVLSVVEGGAAQGVILADDILFELEGNAVENTSHLQSLLYRYHAGDTVTLKVYRGSEIKTLSVTLK